MFETLVSIVSPLNTPEDFTQLSFLTKVKRLFISNNSLAPTDLTVWLVLLACAAALLEIV
jgi:hypothetical protein